MLNNFYPIYYEATCDSGEEKYYDGGFFYAESWEDAAKQLSEYYGDELVSIHIELYEIGDFTFSVEKARAIKDLMNLT